MCSKEHDQHRQTEQNSMPTCRKDKNALAAWLKSFHSKNKNQPSQNQTKSQPISSVDSSALSLFSSCMSAGDSRPLLRFTWTFSQKLSAAVSFTALEHNPKLALNGSHSTDTREVPLKRAFTLSSSKWKELLFLLDFSFGSVLTSSPLSVSKTIVNTAEAAQCAQKPSLIHLPKSD